MAIQAEGKFTTMDVWRGSRLHSRKTLAVISVFGFLFLAVVTLVSLFDEKGWRGQLVWFAWGLFLLGYLWVVLFYRAHRQVKKSPNLQGNVHFEFDDDGLVIQAAHLRSECKWKGVLKWREGKHCFLIYTAPKFANIFPKRFFQNQADVEGVRNLLRTKVAH